jgi:predicted nucleotidyltransferase component of viral defense system
MSKDLERSLKDRIKAIAKAQNRAFNDLWKTLVLERFLARLSRSGRLDQLIFKGGFLLSKYLRLGRETADLDFSLKGTSGSVDSVRALIEEIFSLPNDDGFIFNEVSVEQMNHPHMQYPGYEVSAMGILGQTRTAIRIDLGIGDHVHPESRSIELLALNNKPLFESDISLQVYPLSYIFAEKLEAVVYRGGTNSRMKDFYDLIVLSQLHDFSPEKHRDLIQAVFQHRGTIFPTDLSYDAEAMVTLSRNWKRFVGALEVEFQGTVPADFSEVVQKIDLVVGEL